MKIWWSFYILNSRRGIWGTILSFNKDKRIQYNLRILIYVSLRQKGSLNKQVSINSHYHSFCPLITIFPEIKYSQKWSQSRTSICPSMSIDFNKLQLNLTAVVSRKLQKYHMQKFSTKNKHMQICKRTNNKKRFLYGKYMFLKSKLALGPKFWPVVFYTNSKSITS